MVVIFDEEYFARSKEPCANFLDGRNLEFCCNFNLVEFTLVS